MTSIPTNYTSASNKEICNLESGEHKSTTSVFESDKLISESAEDDKEDKSSSSESTESLILFNKPNDDPVKETNVVGIFSRAKIRYLLLQFFSLFKFIYDFISTTYMMMNADINAFIDFCFNFFGISQERVNKKLLKQFLLVILLVLAFVHSKKDGIHQNFKTQRLFPRHSFVTDYFRGELSLLRNEILSNEFTLVMFYAPWDRQSQNFASHYLKVAQYHHEQVTFTAINCWLPKSECNLHFKLHYYPIIVLHIKLSSMDESFVVSYNGPLSAHHLIRFVSDALHPFTYISDEADLLTMQLNTQVIAVGYYNPRAANNEFVSFYLAALSKLQFEHMLDVRYAVVTDPVLGEKLAFARLPSVHLILWNTTLMFPVGLELNIRNITSFVDVHMTEVSSWLHISGKKSLSLNKVFQDGPFMVLFAPFNPYHLTNGPFQLLRSVALEYWNCQNIPLQLWLTDHFYLGHKAELRDLDRECRSYLKNRIYDRVVKKFEETDYSDELLRYEEESSSSSVCSIEESNTLTHFSWNSVWSSFIESNSISVESHCSKANAPVCRNKNESANERTSGKQKPASKMELEEPAIQGPCEDERIASLIESASEEYCKRLGLASNLSPPPVIKEEKQLVRINGLSCKINRTLRFVAVDSLLHEDFAKKIGLDLKNGSSPYLSGAVIVDPEMEERYILDQDLSRNSLAYFVYNFTYNFLNRGKLVSDISKFQNNCGQGEVCITELNGENYIETINRNKQAFVVLHYSHHCGACSAIGSVLLTCQHLTAGVASLGFARIDVSKNTLPWHLTFENVPTIVFHPHENKSHSRVFNPDLPITVRNVISFIIAGLKPAERTSLALKLCDSECKKSVRRESLLMRIKLHHSLDILGSKLKRHIAKLLETQLKLKYYPNNDELQSKYELLLGIKSNLINKINIIKGKLNHLNNIEKLYPSVPSSFSNQLSFETFTMHRDTNTDI